LRVNVPITLRALLRAACDTSGPSLLDWLLDALIGEAEREGEGEGEGEGEAIRYLIE
jgi:hypothetical protein